MSSNTTAPRKAAEPFLTVQSQPIYFQEDWDTGIGGGLWSTGLALARYFGSHHATQQLLLQNHSNGGNSKQTTKLLQVLELGSGNGLLALCLLALFQNRLERLVITDLPDHLPLIRKTLDANKHLLLGNDKGNKTKTPVVQVAKCCWGEFTEISPEFEKEGFDLIVGSDVAYREELYEPLIATLLHYCSPTTVVLLGVTMNDTQPVFFEMLQRAGFCYEKLADHLLDPEFRGTTFGIFVLRRRNQTPSVSD